MSNVVILERSGAQPNKVEGLGVFRLRQAKEDLAFQADEKAPDPVSTAAIGSWTIV